MKVKFVKPTKELIESIAKDMRQADIDEIWASDHYTPLEALMSGWEVSDRAAIAIVNNEPCVMLGLVICDILTGTGSPWMLGTDNALKYKRQFLVQTPSVIAEMLILCPQLFNYVHVKNDVSVGWLKWLGFTMDKPQPYGIEGEMFHRFHIERIV